MATPDFLATIRDESTRFRDVLTGADPDTAVPTCPDWTADDLLWHLTEVQWFWGTIVSQNVADPESLEHPERPDGHDALLRAFDDAQRELTAALRDTASDETRWMWTADAALHTAGYIARRQAHEALIHRVDAELTSGATVSGIDPTLAADGVDEIVAVMYGREHPLLTFAAAAGSVIELVATDAGRRWMLQLGRETATLPESGERIDDPNFRPAPDAIPAATISGTAADLDLWLWNRPTAGTLARSGDAQALAAMDDVLLREGVK
ncbi:maleylpyruvate isomerase N-terminal domain-containing protein [Flexivirga caeni]|nr:maleylpyruvate isomerase N-terminal domain-containing protein [Flexivirga caeni]